MPLNTEDDLAHELQLSVERTKRLRAERKWPHVRISRNEVRYTAEQIRLIVGSMTVQPTAEAEPSNGQTSRSAKRSA